MKLLHLAVLDALEECHSESLYRHVNQTLHFCIMHMLQEGLHVADEQGTLLNDLT